MVARVLDWLKSLFSSHSSKTDEVDELGEHYNIEQLRKQKTIRELRYSRG